MSFLSLSAVDNHTIPHLPGYLVMPPSKEASGEEYGGRRKRIITSARREQNRVAQKAYRHRIKEARQKVPKNHVKGPQRLSELRPRYHALEASTLSGAPVSGPSLNTGSIATANLGPISRQLVTCPPTAAAPLSNTRELDLTVLPLHASSHGQGQCPSATSDLLPGILPTTDTFSTRLSESKTVKVRHVPDTCVAPVDPIANHIQFSPVQTVTAALNNASRLRLNLSWLLSSDYISPFYQTSPPPQHPQQQQIPDALSLLQLQQQRTSHPWIPADLQPTLAQVLYPHHPFLDLLPFPLLRARAIVLATFAPPRVFDLADFKNDILTHGGLVCWATNARGQPWDMRNWEATPWFLDKWKVLVDGDDGAGIWSQSSWWWTMRAVSDRIDVAER